MKTKNISINFKFKAKKNFISIIIPVYKDALGLEKTIKSIAVQNINSRSYEIIVVNDGGDGDVDHVCLKLGILCISIRKRRGSYYARNVGLENTKGEYLAFIDAGTIAGKKWLVNGIQSLKIYDYAGGPIEITKNPEEKISETLFLYQKAATFRVRNYMEKLHFSPTTNLFVKRSVVEKLGGFDGKLQSAGDWEFGDRIFRSAIFSQKYINSVKVYHFARSFGSLIRKSKRVSVGQSRLDLIFPKRFNNRNLLSIFRYYFFQPLEIIGHTCISQLSFVKKIKVVYFAYFFRFINLFNYISHIRLVYFRRSEKNIQNYIISFILLMF